MHALGFHHHQDVRHGVTSVCAHDRSPKAPQTPSAQSQPIPPTTRRPHSICNSDRTSHIKPPALQLRKAHTAASSPSALRAPRMCSSLLMFSLVSTGRLATRQHQISHVRLARGHQGSYLWHRTAACLMQVSRHPVIRRAGKGLLRM